jgi:hypothetical protein
LFHAGTFDLRKRVSDFRSPLARRFDPLALAGLPIAIASRAHLCHAAFWMLRAPARR